MKIGVLSDIHVDINYTVEDLITPAICRSVKEKDLDLLIIAGDVASDYELTLSSLNQIEKEGKVPCLYVPGNHDIWTENHPDKTSWEIYTHLKSYSHNLAGNSYDINEDWTVVGDLGWYDFSFGDSSYSFQDFERMKFEERVWQDSIMVRWDRSTKEMNSFFLEKLEKQLQQYAQKNLIVVTHVLPIQEFAVQAPNPMWKYLNAFLGSKEYGELFLRYPNVKYSISGHVHHREKCRKGGTEFICNCLGYRNDWDDNTDAAMEVDRAMGIIEI